MAMGNKVRQAKLKAMAPDHGGIRRGMPVACATPRPPQLEGPAGPKPEINFSYSSSLVSSDLKV